MISASINWHEMPKIEKCLKCLKLRYSIDLNRKDRAKRYLKSSIFNRQSSIPALPAWVITMSAVSSSQYRQTTRCKWLSKKLPEKVPLHFFYSPFVLLYIIRYLVLNITFIFHANFCGSLVAGFWILAGRKISCTHE